MLAFHSRLRTQLARFDTSSQACLSILTGLNCSPHILNHSVRVFDPLGTTSREVHANNTYSASIIGIAKIMSDVEFVFFEPKQTKPNPGLSLHEAWNTQLKMLPPEAQARFSVVQARLDELEPPYSHFDCIVSPANSYGIMDGGFDYYLSKVFSPEGDFAALTRCTQAAIRKRFFGFAPTASCTLVALTEELRRNAQFSAARVLAVCPTMRYPMSVGWHRDLVYNTMWSLLVEVEQWNTRAEVGGEERLKKIAMTGLATGAGGISKETCARQMVLAVKHFLIARSDETKKRWEEDGLTRWDEVLPIACEVDEEQNPK